MSAFQEFGFVSERRRAEKAQRMRKRLMIAGAVASVVVILAVVAAVAVVYKPADGGHGNSLSSKHSGGGSAALSSSSSSSDSHKGDDHGSTSSVIQIICVSTDYKSACEASLKKSTNGNSAPKEYVRAAISALVDEVNGAFASLDDIKSDDPDVKVAVEQCREMHGYASGELNRTLGTIDDANSLSHLPAQVHELKNWLSATSAYQQTCIDGFPAGELQDKMQARLESAKRMTSNALTIVGKVSSFAPVLHGSGSRLLQEEEEENHSANGIPAWVPESERRVLESRATKEFTPNVTVAKDGTGDFKTISDALSHLPAKYDGRYVIYVKEGVYEETVEVGSSMINITMYGDGSRKTIVTGSKNFVDGVKTFHTATFAAIGDGFMAVAMGFQNTAGAAKHQAVALRVQSDRAIFLNCRMEGYQDTLYALCHRQFYRGCLILGTIDFIFGDAAAVFQNCILTVLRPLDNQQTIVLAQGRTLPQETTGFVLHNCRIVPDPALAKPDPPPKQPFRNYLGRPWQKYSRTAIMESEIGDFIDTQGYMPWDGDFALKTLTYSEYSNTGGGGGTDKRVNWPGVKVISRAEAASFTPATFIQGGDWIPKTNTPVRLGLFA
ncbi:pectinesterase-like [Zingiber officinale]|uniref:pectinesterase-like n=1 Tax=Zingiber officinale TaxID=94328 RepID=UPI001C4AD29D|nr:pectinesterase-like [Zingiber officinale]